MLAPRRVLRMTATASSVQRPKTLTLYAEPVTLSRSSSTASQGTPE